MKLQEMLNGVKVLEHRGNMDIDVKGVNIDSRNVGKDEMFIAVRGTAVDGHSFIGKAIEQGASIIVCEEMPEEVKGVGYVREAKIGRASCRERV